MHNYGITKSETLEFVENRKEINLSYEQFLVFDKQSNYWQEKYLSLSFSLSPSLPLSIYVSVCSVWCVYVQCVCVVCLQCVVCVCGMCGVCVVCVCSMCGMCAVCGVCMVCVVCVCDMCGICAVCGV